jgi:glutamine amidotransferase PdxT
VRRVGVLALQGDVREHTAMLESIGAEAVAVRRVEQLDDLDGLVLPGGESTTIARLLTTSGIRPVLAAKLEEGFNVFGTCAGLILLSSSILDGAATSGASRRCRSGYAATATGARSRASRRSLKSRASGPCPASSYARPR